VTETKPVESVKDFIDLISETEIVGAKELLASYIKSIGLAWGHFLLQGITPRSVRILMDSMARYVLIAPESNCKMRMLLKDFLEEIEHKARECEKWDNYSLED